MTADAVIGLSVDLVKARKNTKVLKITSDLMRA
jgi:hypothetical protein